MSLKGWGIALLLSPLTFGMSLILYFYIWFFTKIGKFYIKAMTFSVKAAIGLIAWPFKELFGGASWASRMFQLFYYQGTHNVVRHNDTTYAGKRGKREPRSEQKDDEGDEDGFLHGIKSGLSFFSHYKLRYVLLFAGIFYLMGFPSILTSLVSSPAQLMTVSGFIDFLPMLLILAFPFILTLIISAVSCELLGDGVVFWKASRDTVQQAKRLGKGTAMTAGAAAGAASAAGQTAKNAVQGGMNAAELGETAVTTASHISTAGNMIGGEGAAAEGAAVAEEAGLLGLVEGSAVASALSTALPVAVVLAVAWFVYTLIAGIISLILVLATWGYFIQLMPMIAGAVMPALGLGEAYGQWFGQSTANTVGPQVGSMFQEEARAAQQMAAKLGCMAKGPQCYRQWQMNNTVRPGSDSRGETYELRIDRFRTSQEKIDVAYKEKGYSLPISFLVYNTRHGLKGINARNVSYRISVEDSSHQGDNAYCSTGWRKIDTGTGNYILPGLGVQPRESMDDLNLSACGLLQPSMGVNRVLAMDLKYEYSSQATLYFDAMSRKHRREQQIMPDFKKSKTAKTPVQSYINVNSPVTYYTLENGSRRSVPFPARFGFQTPGFSIKYNVDPQSVEIDDSVYTEHIEDSCRGIEHQGGNNYEMSQRAIDRIESRQNDTWFTNGINPAPLKCTFQLTQSAVDTINPTGTELLMRIDANYTIVRQQQHSTFELVNTRCSRKNCPLLVTEGYNETHSGNMFSKCDYGTSVDSYGGCSVLVPEGNGDIDWADPDTAETNGGQDLILEQGETAYSLTEFKQNVRDRNIPSTTLWENGSYQSYSNIIGADEDKFDELASSSNGVSIFEDQGELRMREVQMKLCDENSNKKSQFANAWKERYGVGDVMMMKIKHTDCRNAYKNMIQGYQCEIDFAAEIIQQGVGWNTFIEGGGWFGNTQTACHDLYNRLQGCEGVLVSRNDRVRCVT